MILFPTGLVISDQDAAILLDVLFDADSNSGQSAIENWVRGALAGKASSCRTRLVDDWTVRLRGSGGISSFPSNIDEFIALIFSRSDYQDRATREVTNGRTAD